MPRFGLEQERDLVREKGLLRKRYASVVGWGFLGGFVRSLYFKRATRSVSFERALDAGCGHGMYSFYLARRHPRAQIDAVDYAESEQFRESLEVCERIRKALRLTNVSFRKLNLLELDADAAYDFILCIDVLEHIPDNRTVIEAFQRALKPGGHLYLHMPLSHELESSTFKISDDYCQDIETEHTGDMYSREELLAVVREAGLEPLRTATTFGPIAQLLWNIDKVLSRRCRPLYVLALPFLKLLSYLDLLIPHRSGDALEILAVKPC